MKQPIFYSIDGQQVVNLTRRDLYVLAVLAGNGIQRNEHDYRWVNDIAEGVMAEADHRETDAK